MRKRQKALAGLGLLAVAGTVTATVATTAQAAPPIGTLGSLTIAPATGLDVTAPVYTTSAGCPDAADAYNLFVYGPGGFTDGLIATTTTDVNLSHTGGFPIQQGLSFKDIALDHQTTVQPGRYDVVANCVDSFAQQVIGTFTLPTWFTDATHYQNTDPAQPPTSSTTASTSDSSTTTSTTTTTVPTTTTIESTTTTTEPTTTTESSTTPSTTTTSSSTTTAGSTTTTTTGHSTTTTTSPSSSSTTTTTSSSPTSTSTSTSATTPTHVSSSTASTTSKGTTSPSATSSTESTAQSTGPSTVQSTTDSATSSGSTLSTIAAGSVDPGGTGGSQGQTVGTTVGNPSKLASTGFPAGVFALAGVGLLGAGIVTVLLTRRHRIRGEETHA